MLMSLDHVQLAIPPGKENDCRLFYCGLLGMIEVAKPPELAKRGGLWLRSGTINLHLGVEPEFQPARKAHPAFRVADLDLLAKRLKAAGYEAIWDKVSPNERRFFVHDGVGNRLEMIAAAR